MIKNYEILASTLAQQKMNEISLKGTTSLMFANMFSQYLDDPNQDFIDSLHHQMSEVVKDQSGQFRLQPNNGT